MIRNLAIYLLLALVLLIPGAAVLPLMDRDEPRFAQATWEMMEAEQWTVPYFNGEYRFDKPPLTYWWMRVHYWVFGKSELGARLHSVIAAGLAAFLVFRLGSFLFSEKAGFFAGIGFLTCLQVMIHGRLCVADMPMILAVIATMDASARLVFKKSAPKRFGGNFWYLVGALAFGFLAKGPIAWAVPVFGWLLFRWPFGRQRIDWRRLQIGSAFGLVVVIVGVWGIPAMLATNWEFFKIGIGEHVVDRGLKPLNGRSAVPGIYYLGTAFLSLLPWSAFGVLAFSKSESERRDPSRSFLLAWFVAPFLIFSFYATQLPHYILPGFAAFFLLLFRTGEGIPVFPGKRRANVFFWIVTGVMAVAAVAVAAVSFRLPGPWERMRTAVWLVFALILLIGVVIPIGLRFCAKSERSFFAVIGVLVCGAGLVTHLLASEIRFHHPTIQMTETIFTDQPEKTKFAAFEFTEPSQVFYRKSRHGWKFTTNLESMHNWLNLPSSRRVGVFRTKVWKADQSILQGKSEPAVDQTDEVLSGIDQEKYRIETLRGFNGARTTMEEIVVAVPRD